MRDTEIIERRLLIGAFFHTLAGAYSSASIGKDDELVLGYYVTKSGERATSHFSEEEARHNMTDGSQLYLMWVKRLE